jgi:hypothetical protein
LIIKDSKYKKRLDKFGVVNSFITFKIAYKTNRYMGVGGDVISHTKILELYGKYKNTFATFLE